jgi:hypothetical protein
MRHSDQEVTEQRVDFVGIAAQPVDVARQPVELRDLHPAQHPPDERLALVALKSWPSCFSRMREITSLASSTSSVLFSNLSCAAKASRDRPLWVMRPKTTATALACSQSYQ